MATAGAVSEAGHDAAGSPRWDSELLPDEGAAGSSGSREREHQGPLAPRTRIQESPLPSAEGPAHGGDPDRICGLQESSLKCGSHRILAESQIHFLVYQ